MPYTIEGMADDTLGLLDALHLDRVHVVGISMGGRIAIELAARCRDRVDKLVLVSTSAAGTGRIRMSVPMRLMSVAQWIPSLHGKYPQPRSAHQRQRQASTSYDGTGRLEQIHTPTLIMHGRRDKSIPLSRAEALHKAIAGSQLRVFAGGHMFCFLTERDEFLAQIDRFLTS